MTNVESYTSHNTGCRSDGNQRKVVLGAGAKYAVQQCHARCKDGPLYGNLLPEDNKRVEG